MIKKCLSLLVIIIALIIFFPKDAKADILDPWTQHEFLVDIYVTYNQQKISDSTFNAIILGCYSEITKQRNLKYQQKLIPQLRITKYDSLKNCYWMAHPFFWEQGTRSTLCRSSGCHFLPSWFPGDEFKLAIFVPSINKVFITDEVSKIGLSVANIRDLDVELFSDGSTKITKITTSAKEVYKPPIIPNGSTETTVKTPSPLSILKDKISLFSKAFLLTILLELLVSFVFLSRTKISKKILIYVLLANIISLPIAWLMLLFLFPFLIGLFSTTLTTVIITILATPIIAIFVLLFESWFIYRLGRRRIAFSRALMLSILNNITSFFVGGGLLSLFG